MTSLIPIIAGPVEADSDAQLIELWLHGKSAHTQAAYRTDVNRFFQFVGKPLPQVMLRDLQNFVDSLGGAVSSRRRAISSLKSLFSFGLRVGYLRVSVATAI